MKKILAAVIAAVLTFTGMLALAGCAEGYHYEIDWDVDLSNPIEINALYPETSDNAFGTGDTASIISQVTGYTVNYTMVTGDADNQINSMLSTQEQYHIMKLTEAQYHPYLEDGWFLDLTELLENTESGRKLYDLINLTEYGWDAVTYTDENGEKHIYGIPDFGYCMMEDSALIWNVDHLKQIGYVNEDGSVKVPSTIAEFTDAVTKCQEKFGANNASYHAFDIPGENSVWVSPFMGAFEVPLNFYLDDDGNIQKDIYSKNMDKFVTYLNGFYESGILSNDWTNGSSSASLSSFANENCSVTFQPYWYVDGLVNAIVSKGTIAENLGIDNDYRTVHDEAIAWTTRIRGDGTSGSYNQESAKLPGGDHGVSYYTVIPSYMAEYAVYIIDFLGKKMENYDEFYGGQEGTHWNRTETPAGAKDYYAADDYSYQEYETYSGADSVIYLRPYEYSYRVGEQKADGTYETKTVTGGGYWVKLTQRYLDQIVDNSMYTNGTNSVSSNILFHLRETGFDAWQVAVPMDDTIIEDPMSMSPPLDSWAPISILSRTVAKRGVASAIGADDPVAALDNTREGLKEKSTKKNGIVYKYWSDAISQEMTEWYNSVKLKRS